MVQTRSGGKSRRFTPGQHGLITADDARHKAERTIVRVKEGEASDRVRLRATRSAAGAAAGSGKAR